ncbi:MAG TPA: hypothetical protein PK245_06995, partial [Clostridia bacterium]|nr:hypothetical protein [Clostridia bacterium]
LFLLVQGFLQMAQGMHDNANGIETEEVNSAFFERAPKSVGNGTTTAQDMASYEDAAAVIYALSEQVAMRLRSCNMEANGVSLNIKYPDFEGISRQLAFDYSTSNATDLAEGALCLLKENHSFAKCPLRAVTVTAIKLTPEDSSQISFFDEKRDKESRLERAADKIRSKYGYSALRRGITLGNDVIIGHKLAAEDDFLPFKH